MRSRQMNLEVSTILKLHYKYNDVVVYKEKRLGDGTKAEFQPQSGTGNV